MHYFQHTGNTPTFVAGAVGEWWRSWNRICDPQLCVNGECLTKPKFNVPDGASNFIHSPDYKSDVVGVEVDAPHAPNERPAILRYEYNLKGDVFFGPSVLIRRTSKYQYSQNDSQN